MAVIGAGPIGLACARAMGKYGIPYDQFEADAGVGGNWRHGVYDTVHIISSKKTTEYADFPMPDSYPDFPSRGQLLAYLEDYARHFGLLDRICFDTKVVFVRPCENDLWELTLESGERRRYKGVLVCNGHHWDRFMPEYEGTFTGELIHSKDYVSPEQLRGRRVLVIGGGNSGCDIVSEAARVAASAHFSIRRGHWFMPKTLFGVPLVEFMRPWMPLWLQRGLLRLCLAVVVGDYRRYGLPKPDHRIFETHPTINSELLYYLKQGRITPHPAVRRFDGGTVEFVDGGRETIDLVVCATGYRVSFPFLPEGLVPVRGPIAEVYGGGVLADYKHLYIIGTAQVRYGFGPLITPYSDLICELIRLQDGMALPIGRVIRAAGYKLPNTHLVCPFQAMRSIRRSFRYLPMLLPLEKRLRRTEPEFHNRPIEAPSPRLEPLTVY